MMEESMVDEIHAHLKEIERLKALNAELVGALKVSMKHCVHHQLAMVKGCVYCDEGVGVLAKSEGK